MNSIRRALLSVSDKTGIQPFARSLADRGFVLLSTGGTARALRAAGLDVVDVADVTGHPEMMEGRVKTLHPAVHAGLLARRNVPGDLAALGEHGYAPIDLVAVNLYPFRETIAAGAVSVAEAMEQVDIGGPTMIRAAAKNHADVWPVVDPADYPRVIEGMDEEGGGAALRRKLAGKVFAHVSGYDAAIAAFLRGDEGAPGEEAPSPDHLTVEFARLSTLRYGENPDQEAAFYGPAASGPTGIAALDQRHGKELSYNNLLDIDGALLSLSPFALSLDPVVCIVKHTTPCGIGIGESVEMAYRRALATDPVSAFGSVIAVNREVDEGAAHAIHELFVECIVAPGFTEGALDTLTRKKNIRILTLPEREYGALPVPVSADHLEVFDAALGRDEDAMRAARFLALYGRDPDGPLLRGILRRDPRPGAAAPPVLRGGGSVLEGHDRACADAAGDGRPGLRVGEHLRGKVERDPAGQGRCHDRDRCRANVEGRRIAARGPKGGRRGPRGRRERAGVGCVLPIPGRGGGRSRGRCQCNRSAGRFGAGSCGDRSGEPGRYCDDLYRPEAVSPLVTTEVPVRTLGADPECIILSRVREG